MSRQRAARPAVLLAGVLLASCGGRGGGEAGAGTTVPVPEVAPTLVAALGDPLVTELRPAVVPDLGEVDPAVSDGSSITYRFPQGTPVAAVQAWYARHMRPGDDYLGMPWLRTEVEPRQRWVDNVWCRDRGEVLYVTIGQDAPDSTWVMIGVAAAPEGDCRSVPPRP